MIGGSDAGAHLDMMCGAIYTTALLAHGVREFEVVTLEEAIHLITDVPARLYGLRERGRIAPGWHADLVLFDPAPSATSPSARATTCPVAHRVWWPTPGDHARCGSAASRCAATAWRPVRCRARCCGRAATPRRCTAS